MTSIRFRLINWLKRIGNHAAKQAMQELCGSQAQAKPGRYLANPFIVGVNNASTEGQVDNTVDMSGFRYHVDELNRTAGVTNFPPFGPDSDFAARLNDHFVVAHSKNPLIANPAQSSNSPALQKQFLRSFAADHESSASTPTPKQGTAA